MTLKPPIDDKILVAILEVMKTTYWYSRELKEIFKPYDISHEQFNILKILEHNQSRHFSLKEIQSRVMNKTENTTRLVEKLKKKNLVRSEYSQNSRRTLEISITRSGLEILQKINKPLMKMDKRLKAKWTQKDALEVTTLLRKVRSA